MRGRILHSVCMKEAQKYAFAQCFDNNESPPYEPNYLAKTHGMDNPCCKNKIKSFERRDVDYVFYITKYKGKIETYRGNYFIIGYFGDISYKYNSALNRTVLYGGENSKFVSIENSLKITKESWLELFPKFPGFHLRWLGGGRILNETQINYLLSFFSNKIDETDRYIRPVMNIN